MYRLDEVEEQCRKSALDRIILEIEEGGGLGYFLQKGISSELLTALVRDIYCKQKPREHELTIPDDLVLQQMAVAQM